MLATTSELPKIEETPMLATAALQDNLYHRRLHGSSVRHPWNW
jgi:hypothetical protein